MPKTLILQRQTIGWQPSCKGEAEAVPATILDPFGGSGTTALVANALGRDAILIEANENYCRLAARRIKDAAPLLNEVEVRSNLKEGI